MPTSADAFPLTPFWPLNEPPGVSRKIRLPLASGKMYIRSQGTDLPVWELTGECSLAERVTLLQFYELHACCGCTLTDERYSPAEDHVVQFQEKPDFKQSAYGRVIWTCTLVETTVA